MKIKTLPVFAIFLVIAFSLTNIFAGMSVDLTGRITEPAGKSIKVTVLIRYAERKTNVEPSLSLRYPLLPLHVQTDNAGNFKINSLDSRWIYYGYAIAPDCTLQQLKSIDPATGPLNITLETADTNVPSERAIHGRVIDANGHPISGALIDVGGSTRNGQTTWPAQDIDFYSVSDDAGNFVIYGKTPFIAADGSVEADGFAKASFEQWPSDAANDEWTQTGSMPQGIMGYAKPLHQITLGEGASLRGRLLQNSKPVPDAEIRLNGCEAGSDCWFWQNATLTDANGNFCFIHLPTNTSYSICGTWDLLTITGAVPQTNVQTGKNNSTNDIGEIHLKSVCDVAGKIHLSDGRPIPAKAFFYLSDAAMGSSSPVAFGNDGSFHFPAVSGDKVSMFLRIPGYELTPRDSVLKSGSVTNITVRPDLTNWVIEMKPFSRIQSLFRAITQ